MGRRLVDGAITASVDVDEHLLLHFCVVIEFIDDPASGALPEPLAAIAAAISRLAALDVERVPSGALGDGLAAMRQDIDALEAQFSRWLFCFDRSRAFAVEGSNSATSWLRSTCRLSGGAAAERVQVARELATLPETKASFDAGEIGYQHAAVIARSAAELGSASMEIAEPALLQAAERLDPGQLRMLSREMRYRLDPAGALAADNAIFEQRRLTISQLASGAFLLDGMLDAEGGAMVRTALGALDGPPAPHDERRPEQRRADALVELASRQLRGGALPSVHGQRPHLVVTASLAELRGVAAPPGCVTSDEPQPRAARLAAPAGPASMSLAVSTDTATPATASATATSATATPATASATATSATAAPATSAPAANLQGAGPIAAATLRRLACDASVTTLTTGAAGQALDVGRTTRVISPALRIALVHRDRGCRYPGCDLPPEWTDGHHLWHWTDGGPTKLENLVLLCFLCRCRHKKHYADLLIMPTGLGLAA